MRLSLAAFGNRVAWRIFARFVVASLVPLAAVAALFLVQINRTAEQRALLDLGGTSRSVGQVLLDKLVLVNDWLPRISEETTLTELRLLGLMGVRLERTNSSVTIGEPFELPALPRMTTAGKPALALTRSGDGTALVIARALPDGTLFGRIDPEYLAAAASLATGAVATCVLAGSVDGEPLFCTARLPASAGETLASLRAKQTGSSGDFTWSDGRETWVAAYWDLFTPSLFNADTWTVIAGEPRSVALYSVSTFGNVAPQALALSLLLTVLLSFSQIRRTLDPLNRLVAGTKRIAAQDFSARIDDTSSDEFGSLGQAMNDMADRLGRQFGTLTMLAQIDRLILSSDSVDGVVQTALVLIRESLGAKDAAIYLSDADDDVRGRLYRRVDGSLAQARVEISDELRTTLLTTLDGELMDDATAATRLGALSLETPAAGLFVVPILRGTALGGAIIATCVPDTGHRIANSLRELADRLAVAIAASEREKKLFQRAHFDVLTGIPNRQLCRDRLQQALAQSRRDGHRVAVLFLDLDGFKTINDSLGHVAGDELLKEMALRLTVAVRDTDTVARFGGDEYVAVLPGLQSTLEVETVVARVMRALEQPFVTDGRESYIGGSIGVTIFPEDGTSPEELLRKADTAMYNAKAAGRGRCVYFTKDMELRVQERLALGSELRKALEKHELYLVYQPQLELESGRVLAAEALLRWRHPVRGELSPASFIPLLEESGLIESVGAWVVQTALTDLADWQRSGLSIERVAVNVTTRQLLSPAFEDVVSAALEAAGLDARCLELELTETTFIEDLNSANSRLNGLATRGVRIAIDDFGTGYSSLGYLNELTFDSLKIDRGFVVNLPADKAVAIVKAIVGVAHALAKDVVAEGIESEIQKAQLTRLGCDHGQGYLFSAPLEAPRFASWLAAVSPASPTIRLAQSR
jgi:diguanylate cyclase (GGDEF)-like protein